MSSEETKKAIPKILTVDDEIENQKFYKTIIEQLNGWQCLTAFNGYEALELLKEHQDIDLLITDVNMPQMCGRTLVSEIKKNYPDHKFKIIIMTAENIEDSFKEEHQIYAVLTKPDGFSVIYNVIKDIELGLNNEKEN